MIQITTYLGRCLAICSILLCSSSLFGQDRAKDSRQTEEPEPLTLAELLAAYEGNEDSVDLNLDIAMAYYDADSAKWGLPYSLKAQALAPENADPYYVSGILYYTIDDFEQAVEMLYRAVKYNPSDNIYLLLNLSRLYRNTDMEQIDKATYKLRHMNTNNIPEMTSWATDSNSRYFYPALLQKHMAEPRNLGIDEYFMLYMGQAKQDDYSPYLDNITDDFQDIKKLYDDEKYEEFIEKALPLYKKSPLHLDVNWYLAASYYRTEQYEQYDRHIATYRSIIYSITRTGDGKGPETAYVVVNTNSEYALLGYYGLRSGGQSLYNHEGHMFDALTCKDTETGETFDVYFNVDLLFEHLSGMFSDLDMDEKKTKKKKTKKSKKKTSEPTN